LALTKLADIAAKYPTSIAVRLH